MGTHRRLLYTESGGGRTYTYAGTGYANPHAATAIGGTSYAYDANGNVTSAGTRTYGWDYRDRLTSSANGGASTTYAYDHENQRVTRTVDGVTTRYPNRYWNVAGATSTAHVTLPDGSLVAVVEGNGSATTTRYLHTDQLGGAHVTTDEAQDVVQVLDYYPYGDPRIKTGTDVSQREYIGEMYDEDSGLNYLNNRYYRSTQGQFLSQDPTFLSIGDEARLQNLTGLTQGQILSDPQQLNSYSYGRDNPIRFKDPKGLYIESGFDVAMLALSINSFRQDPSFLNAAGVVLDAGSLALPGIPAVGGLALRAGKVADATYSVYQGVDSAGVVRYVGITGRNPAVRIGEHLQSIGTGKEALEYRVINGTGNLSRDQARIMEQSLINTNGLQKNGGTLLNKINSISPSSQLYKSVLSVPTGGGSSGGGGGVGGVLNALSSALKQLSSILGSFKK